MLTDALRAFVNRPFLESFNTFFYGKYKKLSKKSVTFFFSHKTFLKTLPKPMPFRASVNISHNNNNNNKNPLSMQRKIFANCIYN